MMDLEFTFEQAPWEESLMALQPGDTISAMQLLTLLEGESEDTAQNVLLELEARHVALDITDSVINCAIENQCNLIVTHHPFLMEGLKSIDLIFPF